VGFYSGSRILVTGSGGFLATHLVSALLAAGANVRVVGRRPRPAHYPDAVEYLRADLLEHSARVAGLRGAELVFHLAAIGWGLHENMKRQGELLTQNLMLNTMLLDDASRAGVRGYLYTSSSSVYPSCLEELDEDAPWDQPPHQSELGFGWAKRMGEIQAQIYHQNCGMPIAIVRPANPYGPWDDFGSERSHVIPALIRRAFAREDPFVVWGSGRPLRSFIYAPDAARVMMLALEKQTSCRPVNIASPQTTSIAELVSLVLRLSGHAGTRVVFDTSKPDGHPRKVPGMRRAAALGMTEYISLGQGLEETIAWYREHALQRIG
jgi:GDP-L-fucose synthase